MAALPLRGANVGIRSIRTIVAGQTPITAVKTSSVLAAARVMKQHNIGAILGDPYKRRAAAVILGQAYLTGLACVRHNRDAVAQIADTLVERKELYGDEVVDLLNAAGLEAPAIDITDETIWPKL